MSQEDIESLRAELLTTKELLLETQNNRNTAWAEVETLRKSMALWRATAGALHDTILEVEQKARKA